jgi:predicted  nucleic acid-binding Zn-ribbon protein
MIIKINPIQISKLDRDHTNTQLKWIEVFQKENEELKNNLKESNEELNEFREYNGKLEYMLENERTENFYLTREIGSLNGSNKNLLDELQYQILENDNLMSEIDNLKKKIELLTQK